MEALVDQKRVFSSNFSKAYIKFCLNWHYNADNSNSFVNGKEICKFQVDNKNVYCITQFFLGSISNRLSAIMSREVSLNRNMYDFSVDCNSIDKSDILNIHKYLMKRNIIKYFLALLKKCLLYY